MLLPEYKLKCPKCKHKWSPRVENPVQCPRCKNPLKDPQVIKAKEERQ